MKQIFKPYSILMHFLAFVFAFFVGLIIAKITEAGKGQMLAGGAIVLGYGVISALVGFFVSIVASVKVKRTIILKINGILAVLIGISILYFYLNFQKHQEEKPKNEPVKREQPTKPSAPAEDVQHTEPLAILTKVENTNSTSSEMGLGMFTPNFYESKVLYFYGNITSGKSVQEHTPTDSITFKQKEHGGFDIATAPPWLVPEHLKLDYDLVYFKVQSISHDFIEVVVNTTNKQTSFVDRYAGKIHYWPEFLLNVNSVEFLEPSKNTIYIKPIDHTGTVNVSYSFMRPLKVKNEWMFVELVDDNYKAKGNGWIRWYNDGKLLIRYYLLS